MNMTVQKQRSSRRKVKQRKGHWQSVLLVTVFLLGLGLLLYPWFSDYWNSLHQSRAIMEYADEMAKMNPAEYRKILGEAKQYNEKLAKNGIHWKLTKEEKKAYESQLDFESKGIMGYISIPKIRVELPIYHGTSEETLQTAIGHLEGSSLPVGGENTHTLLSGHRGLPSAKLFTNLDQLSEGDLFMLHVMDETLTYEVDRVRTVEPEDLSSLWIEPGKDYCTLITCTPYGINTHRLLVRGHRTANINGDANVVADAIQVRPVYAAPFFAIPILLLLTTGVWIIRNPGTGKVLRKLQRNQKNYGRTRLRRKNNR